MLKYLYHVGKSSHLPNDLIRNSQLPIFTEYGHGFYLTPDIDIARINKKHAKKNYGITEYALNPNASILDWQLPYTSKDRFYNKSSGDFMKRIQNKFADKDLAKRRAGRKLSPIFHNTQRRADRYMKMIEKIDGYKLPPTNKYVNGEPISNYKILNSKALTRVHGFIE